MLAFTIIKKNCLIKLKNCCKEVFLVELNKNELININGGSKTIWLVLGGIALFAIGVFCGLFEK